MCCDPSSPIAKVEQGQGYYLRTHTISSYGTPRNFVTPTQPSLDQDLFGQSPEAVDLAIQRAQKFRAVVERLSLTTTARVPFSFAASFSDGAPFHNLWKFPDLALVEWHVASEEEDGGLQIDRRAFQVRHAAAQPAFSLSTVKLKMEIDYRNYRESFFQCLSHTAWANSGELAIACPVTDENLADDLRKLGAEYGLGITTYGLDSATVDAVPDAQVIRKMEDREFDALQARLNIQKLNTARSKSSIEWHLLERAASENEDARKLLEWISSCLSSGKIQV